VNPWLPTRRREIPDEPTEVDVSRILASLTSLDEQLERTAIDVAHNLMRTFGLDARETHRIRETLFEFLREHIWHQGAAWTYCGLTVDVGEKRTVYIVNNAHRYHKVRQKIREQFYARFGVMPDEREVLNMLVSQSSCIYVPGDHEREHASVELSRARIDYASSDNRIGGTTVVWQYPEFVEHTQRHCSCGRLHNTDP
jgi:hypothetical protein